MAMCVKSSGQKKKTNIMCTSKLVRDARKQHSVSPPQSTNDDMSSQDWNIAKYYDLSYLNVIYGNIWQCVAMCGNVWQYVGIQRDRL